MDRCGIRERARKKSAKILWFIAVEIFCCHSYPASWRHRRHSTRTRTYSFPTDPFIVLEPRNPSIDNFYITRKLRSTEFKAQKLWKAQSGCKEARVTETLGRPTKMLLYNLSNSFSHFSTLVLDRANKLLLAEILKMLQRCSSFVGCFNDRCLWQFLIKT